MPKAAEAAYAPKANPSDPLALKKEGNEHFKRGSLESAAKCYTTAIDLWMEPKERAVLYVNRSAARIKQAPEPGCTAAALAESALRDAERAIDLDSSYPKGHFRRAQALMALGRHVDAAASLATVLSLSPGDAAAQALLHEVERKLPSVPEAERSVEAGHAGTTPAHELAHARAAATPAATHSADGSVHDCEFVTGATPPQPPATNGS
jgi:tetratricopeptide (TPR) repeat protein